MPPSARAATIVPTRTRGRRLPIPRPAGDDGSRSPATTDEAYAEIVAAEPGYAEPPADYADTAVPDEHWSPTHTAGPIQDDAGHDRGPTQDYAGRDYETHAYRETPREYPSEADEQPYQGGHRPAYEGAHRQPHGPAGQAPVRPDQQFLRPAGPFHPGSHPPVPPQSRSGGAETIREPGIHGADSYDQPDERTGRSGGRLGAESAWRLLRRWRPGRRHTDDDVEPSTFLDDVSDLEQRREPASPWAPIIVENESHETGFHAGLIARPAPVQPLPTAHPAGGEDWSPFAEAATTGPVPAAAAPVDSADQLAADREALRSLGVPASWTRLLQSGDRFTAIVRMLDRLPQHEIVYDAEVIAVLGPADVVELEAHRTALDLPEGGRPRAVAVLPHDEHTDLRAAFARAQQIRPVVVAVPVADHESPATIHRLLTGLQAGAAIAVVDASRPLEEITRWVEAIEHVDALALDGALDSETPAGVLSLGVPVIRVDGIPVDRISWAALLCAQLTALDAGSVPSAPHSVR
jgi:hypothetical protein